MADTEEKVGKNPTVAPVSLDEIPEIQREGKSSRVIEEFLASGEKAARVDDHTKGFLVSLRRYVKMNGAPVDVLNRGGQIFLRYNDEQDETPDTAPEGDENA